MKETPNASRLLKTWEILQSETDADHPIDTVALQEKLAAMGLPCDRRTIYDDIKTLNANGCEVLKERGRRNRYYVVDRGFDEAELHILMDAVQSAGFISDKKTKELTDKIARLSGSRTAEVLKKNIVRFNTVKTTNESVYYNVDTVVTAIQRNKKVSFLYFDYDDRRQKVYRKEGQKYVVSPVFTAFSDDNYYLVGFNDKYNNVSPYRIDRMEKVSVVDEEPDEEQKAKISKLADKKIWFNMYTGESQKVTFAVKDENRILGVVYDRFGKDITFVRGKGDTVRFSAEVQLTPTFFGWLFSLGDNVKVVAPASVVERVKEEIASRLSLYDD